MSEQVDILYITIIAASLIYALKIVPWDAQVNESNFEKVGYLMQIGGPNFLLRKLQ